MEPSPALLAAYSRAPRVGLLASARPVYGLALGRVVHPGDGVGPVHAGVPAGDGAVQRGEDEYAGRPVVAGRPRRSRPGCSPPGRWGSDRVLPAGAGMLTTSALTDVPVSGLTLNRSETPVPLAETREGLPGQAGHAPRVDQVGVGVRGDAVRGSETRLVCNTWLASLPSRTRRAWWPAGCRTGRGSRGRCRR